jgi:hypothetical protein
LEVISIGRIYFFGAVTYRATKGAKMSLARNMTHAIQPMQITEQTLKSRDSERKAFIHRAPTNARQNIREIPDAKTSSMIQRMIVDIQELQRNQVLMEIKIKNYEMRLRVLEWNPRGKGGPEFEKVWREECEDNNSIIVDRDK